MTIKTASEILADIKQFRAEFDRYTPRPGELSGFGPLKIVESTLCVRDSDKPKRIHKRRRWMSTAYHLRIQKKWVKRFGYAPEYLAFQVDPRAAGMPGEPYLAVHPMIAQQMREEARQREMRQPIDALRRASLISKYGSWL